MAGKKFKATMMGYDKEEVDAYLKNIFEDFENKLIEKDEEILKLLSQIKVLTKKYDSIKIKEEAIDAEKDKISKALVRADETYSKIIEDAKKEAKDEVEALENRAEVEREKIVDIKKELLELKEVTQKAIEKYSNALKNLNIDLEENDTTEEEEKPEVKTEENDENDENEFEYVEYKITDDAEEIRMESDK